jgi:GAF domain-containing protein
MTGQVETVGQQQTEHHDRASILAWLEDEVARAAEPWLEVLARVVTGLAASHPTFDWTGIYLLEGQELVLGPFVGEPTEHVRIPVGRGICGAAVAERDTIVVDDVHADPRYLACFATTRSEIVVPIITADGRVIGEIDVDSEQAAAFGADDRAMLEHVAALLARLAPPEAHA